MNTIRTFPKAEYPFLRFQIGRMETRPEQVPIWEDKKIVGYKEGRNKVPVFRLMGFGSTLELASQMMRDNS